MNPFTAMPRLVEISGAEALWLLEGTATGRVVFTLRGLPAVRPAGHLMEHGTLVVRAPLPPSAVSMLGDQPAIVTYHADDIDPATGAGWSVTATGPAEPVSDLDAAAHYRRVLQGWTHGPHDTLVRLSPHAVHGHRTAVTPGTP